MPYQLFIDYALFETIRKIPVDQRRRMEERFRQIQHFPANQTDFVHTDESGRTLNVSR